jgi:hypothetical protein
MDLFSLFELAQLKAIEVAVDPTLESVWRSKCRDFSQKFFTPLAEVLNMDPSFVLQNLYEEEYTPASVREDLEGILERLYSIKDPTYTKIDKAELEELVDNVMNREIARAKKKKPITQQTIQEDIKKAELNKPKSGGINFSDLEKTDERGELGKSGF